ncbi:MAG: 1-acyl-sn-glycerol-3-phosphate acyltransferase [Anaerolineales bacterium]
MAPNVFFGGHRSFRRDGQMCTERLIPPLRILGKENIPQGGPCLITFNHYYRPGFNAWWMALALAAAVPVDIHFTMTGELTWPGKWYAPLGQAGSRWLLHRFSKIYGFTSMPPMPPREKDVSKRAQSVRATLAFARGNPKSVIGLAPEGGDQPKGVLNWPAKGAGRFVFLLTEQGFPVQPVGVFEENGEFCLHFGRKYRLQMPGNLSSDEKDLAAAQNVMSAIAALVPARLRGVFG